MPETIAPSPATSITLLGNSAGSAPPREIGRQAIEIQWDFASPRRPPARPGTPRKSRGLLTHRQLRCNTTDRPARAGQFCRLAVHFGSYGRARYRCYTPDDKRAL